MQPITNDCSINQQNSTPAMWHGCNLAISYKSWNCRVESSSNCATVSHNKYACVLSGRVYCHCLVLEMQWAGCICSLELRGGNCLRCLYGCPYTFRQCSHGISSSPSIMLYKARRKEFRHLCKGISHCAIAGNLQLTVLFSRGRNKSNVLQGISDE